MRSPVPLMAAIPLYLAFAFGFIRDIWNPFGMRDRGLHAAVRRASRGLLYVFFAFTPISYLTAADGGDRSHRSFLFVSSAQNGLTA